MLEVNPDPSKPINVQLGADDVNEHEGHDPEWQGQGGHQGPDEVGA